MVPWRWLLLLAMVAFLPGGATAQPVPPTPRQLTVSLALGKRFKVEDLEAFYRGLRASSRVYGL